jgi:hypothetical protein
MSTHSKIMMLNICHRVTINGYVLSADDQRIPAYFVEAIVIGETDG